MAMLSTLMASSLILIFTLSYLHVESLSFCSHQFLEQSFRHATQSLNNRQDTEMEREICSQQAKFEFTKQGAHLRSKINSGELEGQKMKIKAETVWGKENEDQ